MAENRNLKGDYLFVLLCVLASCAVCAGSSVHEAVSGNAGDAGVFAGFAAFFFGMVVVLKDA